MDESDGLVHGELAAPERTIVCNVLFTSGMNTASQTHNGLVDAQQLVAADYLTWQPVVKVAFPMPATTGCGRPATFTTGCWQLPTGDVPAHNHWRSK